MAERLTTAKPYLPPNVEVIMGPISTGLGEVYWWSVEYAPLGEAAPVRDGEPGWQSDGSYLTPEGERLSDDLQRLVYLRTVQDWIIRPQMKTVPGTAGAHAIGGYVKQYRIEPDPARLMAYGISFSQIVSAIESTITAGAQITSSVTAKATWCGPTVWSRASLISRRSLSPPVGESRCV